MASFLGTQEALHDRVMTMDEVMDELRAVTADDIQVAGRPALPRRGRCAPPSSAPTARRTAWTAGCACHERPAGSGQRPEQPAAPTHGPGPASAAPAPPRQRPRRCRHAACQGPSPPLPPPPRAAAPAGQVPPPGLRPPMPPRPLPPGQSPWMGARSPAGPTPGATARPAPGATPAGPARRTPTRQDAASTRRHAPGRGRPADRPPAAGRRAARHATARPRRSTRRPRPPEPWRPRPLAPAGSVPIRSTVGSPDEALPGPGDDQAAAAERSADARLARLHLRGGLLPLARAALEQMAGAGTLDVTGHGRPGRGSLAQRRPGGRGRRRARPPGVRWRRALAALILAEDLMRTGQAADARRYAEFVLARAGGAARPALRPGAAQPHLAAAPTTAGWRTVLTPPGTGACWSAAARWRRPRRGPGSWSPSSCRSPASTRMPRSSRPRRAAVRRPRLSGPPSTAAVVMSGRLAGEELERVDRSLASGDVRGSRRPPGRAAAPRPGAGACHPVGGRACRGRQAPGRRRPVSHPPRPG